MANGLFRQAGWSSGRHRKAHAGFPCLFYVVWGLLGGSHECDMGAEVGASYRDGVILGATVHHIRGSIYGV